MFKELMPYIIKIRKEIQMNKEEWLEDLEVLSVELPKRHKNLFFNLSKEDFYNQVNYLKENVEYFDDYEMFAEIAKVVASVGDAHTAVKLPVRNLCPMELYWFSEGIYVISTLPEYKEILHCRISHINSIEISEVIDSVSKVISHENQAFLKAHLPIYLTAMEVLYGLEVVDDIKSLDITFVDINGNNNTVKIKPLPMGEVMEMLKSHSENTINGNNLPFYRRNIEKHFWSQYIESFKTVYFKYNSCKDMDDDKVSVFSRKIMSFIDENDVNKVVIDIRNNCGGNSTLLDPFIENLSLCRKINKKGSLYVIVGRDTFSSALLNAYTFKEKTKAIFLGEPTGGKPNCYGEIERFTLKNSRILITYSTKYYKLIEDDELPSFYPNVNIEVGIHDFINQKDPCMEFILKD
jgi:hypothetical protein